ncbi:MAG: bifunctional DNA-binding transcriptional regulator/O6-methylguanine-DNA methyltransferase Ada [Isosphaeraceae bacterium]
MKSLPASDGSRPYSDSESRWEAVVARDVRADGHFVYSVRTTGVYCRPSCSSRACRRENAAFHESPEAAERAGFRACRRCDPRGESQAARHARAVALACRAIENAETPPRLAELARIAGLSPHHFHRVFRSQTGLTPRAYAAEHQARTVHRELRVRKTVTSAIQAAGFGSSGRFYASEARQVGMSPRTFRAGAPGITIHHAVGLSTLGHVLVAATSSGICAIFLGNDPDFLIGELRERFPRAILAAAESEFAEVVAQVIAFVEEPQRGINLPLDIRGTAFQRRVWEALRAIPLGQTTSYAQIAEAIGHPSATRAVAQACAANPIALAIPCHRVVRSDGSLSGYRWGVERKDELLRRERDPH